MSAGRFSKEIFVGARFTRLVVLKRIPRTDKKRSKVLCLCDCGSTIAPNASNLTNGNTKSCGCWKRDNKVRTPKKVKVGERYGRLTIVDLSKGVACKCDCGKSYWIGDSSKLRSRDVKSCGCLNRELTVARNKETAKFEGITKSQKWKTTYKTWRSLLHRLKTSRDYEGVVACRFLKRSPWGLARLLGRRPRKDYTLDRFPIHNGNYTCGQCKECKENGWKRNVRWATRKEQANNRGNFNILLTAFGKTLTRSQWQDLSGIDEWRIHRRINELGWTVERALITPDKKGNHYKLE